MKKFVFLFFIILINNAFAQKTGIVYNINPKMGYSHLEGFMNPKPILEKELNYDFIQFLSLHLDSLNIQTTVKYNFDFSQLNDYHYYYNKKKEADYVLKYCEENGFDRLIIVRRNNAFTSVDPMRIFSRLDHDYGLATLKIAKKRATFYYNFLIIMYSKGEKRLLRNFGSKLFDSKWKEEVYDYNFLLKDEKVFNETLPFFESRIKEGLSELLMPISPN